MANSANNVRVGVTGAVYFAPASTAVPTSVSTALNAAFEDVGYISEDGVTESTATDTNDIRAWQNGDIVRRVQTSHDYSVAFTMIETKAKSLELFYGNFTAGPGGASGVVEVNGEQPYRGAFVLHVIDDTDLIRVVIPDGQVTERGDVQRVNGDATSYPVTITAYPDANGVKAFIYYETDAAS
jgi:hypothetical protein